MDRRLGKPLPHQLANPTRAAPKAINLSPEGHIRHYHPFPGAIPNLKARSHALLTRPPLLRRAVRLACVRPAASVRSEPGSNSQVELTSDLSRSDPILFRKLADLALVLRIIDEIPRTSLRRATSWCLFKKTADVSVDRQSRRTVARTPPPAFLFPDQRFQRPKEPADRPHRLAPGDGGGGDVVASVFRVKRLFRRRTSFRPTRPETREALFSASIFRVKWFFLKKNLCLRTGPGAGGGGLLRKANLRVNQAFSAISRRRNPEDFRPQKTVWKTPRGLPLFRYRRFDWSAEPNRNTLRKQPAFATFFPGNRG